MTNNFIFKRVKNLLIFAISHPPINAHYQPVFCLKHVRIQMAFYTTQDKLDKLLCIFDENIKPDVYVFSETCCDGLCPTPTKIDLLIWRTAVRLLVCPKSTHGRALNQRVWFLCVDSTNNSDIMSSVMVYELFQRTKCPCVKATGYRASSFGGWGCFGGD